MRGARALLYAGIVAAVVGTSKVHAAWLADPPYDYTGSPRFGWSAFYVVLLAATAYATGLPDLAGSRRSALGTALSAAALGALAVSALQLVVGDALLPRFVVFGSAAALVPWYVFCAEVARGRRTAGELRDRVVLVGSDADAGDLDEQLRLAPERPASIVAHLPPEVAAVKVDGSQPVVEAVRSSGATLVVLDREAQASESIVEQVARLHAGGLRVRTLSLFYEEWLGKLPLSELERVSLMFDIGEVHRTRYNRVKRLVDVALGVAGVVPLVLVTPLVALGNVVANRGSLLYHQPRVGKGGRVFTIHKFRTMTPSAAADPAGEWTADDDPRITRFGRLLRLTHVDELPQVVNILVGDLSVVGPRPEQPHYVERLTEKLPFYDLRHLVRPGLTGWAQVKYHYASDDDDSLEKLQYEFYYLRHQRLSFDLRILGRTLRSVVRREGR